MHTISKYIIGFLLAFFCINVVYAQQEAMYSQYMFNTLAINPAYAGSRNVVSATALYRNQWVGIEGAPSTQTISFDGATSNKKVGLGFQVFNDEIGISKTTGAFASYAYRIRMDKGTLAFGLQAGAALYTANFSRVALNPTGAPDVSFAQDVRTVQPNFGAGVYYNSDKFYLGVSVPQMLGNTLNNNTNISSSRLIARQYTHLFIAAGYVFDINKDIKIKPSVLFKGVQGAPLQLDINSNVWFFDIFSIGLQYRTEADIAAMTEIQLNSQIRFGYAYDRSTTRLADFNSGSHEFMLRYEFGSAKSKLLSPRYF
ncbi:PorP/SprF family type IX secretion system membrane protein [Pedobacter glucosidilyticus]|uniref:PorP/SprF family type IX secretion system membrane protein n=1 Tax=Pedobacter glucosidilyticus TaxID=1122941 RepID=UPI0026ECE95C|nr:type IX secretion system membrane protein PorP/SprF [Pedobacter glucosidilyticus]